MSAAFLPHLRAWPWHSKTISAATLESGAPVAEAGPSSQSAGGPWPLQAIPSSSSDVPPSRSSQVNLGSLRVEDGRMNRLGKPPSAKGVSFLSNAGGWLRQDRRNPKRDDMRAGTNAYPAADGANVQCVNLQLQEKNEVVAAMQKSGVGKRRTGNAEKRSPLAAAYESSLRTATRHRI
ncbi:hypothetical protein PAXRUDRAFT_836446 [Paxillus rubicundulus Ve08.2h10]|uniref:Uncharacterized protein n=1 Tax=Paxillus rubicundulus Ve08.2h10 TaxID=930991 RepID=A0A0D0D6J1_9AGAM|nr:hypothetical protein PAXRUDRAFT_836446 [Paxillus rubicundulus Ve08.2h10]